MKKSLALVASIAALLLAAATVRTLAADESVTIKGEGKCAKCALKETKECQNVIQTEKDGKKVIVLEGKRLTFSEQGYTNSTLARIDGRIAIFGDVDSGVYVKPPEDLRWDESGGPGRGLRTDTLGLPPGGT